MLPHVHAQLDQFGVSPSNRVVRALQAADPRIQTKGFRKSAMEALFASACTEHYETEERFQRVCARARAWFGHTSAKQLLTDGVEILESYGSETRRWTRTT